MFRKVVPVLLIVPVLFSGCRDHNSIADTDDPPAFQFENAVQFTSDINDITPRWSPTGEHIVFERRNNIYLLDVSLGSVFLVTEGRSPSWSPSGLYITFIRESELYSVRAVSGGGELKKLSTGSHAAYSGGLDWGASDRIVYFQPGDSMNSDYRLTIYWPYGQDYHIISSTDLGYSEIPRWSRNCEDILFSSMKQGICVYNIEKDFIYSVIYWGNPGKACWYKTTNSQFILFIENGVLYQINPDGSGRFAISGQNFHPGTMDYCYATKQLAFTNQGIWIMDFPPQEKQEFVSPIKSNGERFDDSLSGTL